MKRTSLSLYLALSAASAFGVTGRQVSIGGQTAGAWRAVRIRDLQGRTVFQASLSSTGTTLVAGMHAGLYTAECIDAHGHVAATRLMVP